MPSKILNPKPVKQLTFAAIGTQWLITSKTSLDVAIQRQVQQRIATFDNAYSRFKPASWLRQASAKAGTYTMPDDARPLFDLYQQLYGLTDGAITPLIGQTLAQAGYDENYSLKPGLVTDLPSWDEVLAYDYPTLTIKQPTLLDVGAAGKGYLVDIICAVLQAAGHHNFTVNAGGDIRVCGQAEQVGLENPFDETELIGAVSLGDASLCGSAGNRRRWATFTHIINPHSLNSDTTIAAVWVIAKTALLADGLSTALYFADPETLQAHYTFEYALVYKDHSITRSAGFPELYS